MRTVQEIAREILTISVSLDECEKSINKCEFTNSILVRSGFLPQHSDNIDLLTFILSPEDIMGMYIEECKRRLIELKQELNETN